MKIWRSFFISSIAISIFSSITTAPPFSLLNSQAAESSKTSVFIDSPSELLLDSSAHLSLKNSPQNLAQRIFLPQGVYQVQGRPAIYFFDGSGNYCWYQSPADYYRLTGGTPPTILTDKTAVIQSRYLGICTGRESIPAPHPDPGLFS